MSMGTERAFIHLVRCVVNRESPDEAIVRSADLDELYMLATSHCLGALTASGLECVGIQDARFTELRAKAIRKALIFDAERAKILNALEAVGIWYMPMKGVILKDFYPQVGMREMSDNDILFDADRAGEVHDIMLSLGFTVDIYDEGHRDDYRKPPVSHFEMHRVLFDEDMGHEAFFQYYQDVKRLLVKDGGNDFGYHLSDEDFYVFMIAHEYKHFMWCGTGLRSLLDVYLYLRRKESEMDWAYIARAMDALEIADFEKKNRKLAQKVFGNGETESLTTEERELLNFFMTSGAYGMPENKILNGIRRNGKLRYFFKRVFIPMKAVQRHYPLFYRHKVLLPLLPFYRIICKSAVVRRELKHLIK